MASRIPSGVGPVGTTTVPPRNSTGSTLTPVPPTRKKGAIATVTSSPRKSAQLRKLMTFQVRLAWVSMIPLGDPVVPEVCGSRQTSSMPTATSTGSSGDSATSASKSTAPGIGPATATRRRTGPGATVRSTAPCWSSTAGSTSARTAWIPSGASRWFTGARAAPASPEANSASRNAGWLGPSQATRSPRPTPSRRRPLASRRTRLASSA